MSFNDIAAIYVKRSAYRIHFWYMSKDDAISIMNNSNLVDKNGVFIFFYYVQKGVSATPLKKLIIKETET